MCSTRGLLLHSHSKTAPRHNLRTFFTVTFCLLSACTWCSASDIPNPNVWTGAGSDDRWDNAANWVLFVVPDEHDYVLFSTEARVEFRRQESCGTVEFVEYGGNTTFSGEVGQVYGLRCKSLLIRPSKAYTEFRLTNGVLWKRMGLVTASVCSEKTDSGTIQGTMGTILKCLSREAPASQLME